jgi:tetratricopeptide (TPR) repeat protein
MQTPVNSAVSAMEGGFEDMFVVPQGSHSMDLGNMMTAIKEDKEGSRSFNDDAVLDDGSYGVVAVVAAAEGGGAGRTGSAAGSPGMVVGIAEGDENCVSMVEEGDEEDSMVRMLVEEEEEEAEGQGQGQGQARAAAGTEADDATDAAQTADIKLDKTLLYKAQEEEAAELGSSTQPQEEEKIDRQLMVDMAAGFAEAFTSMSISSVLNQFGDSLILGPMGGGGDSISEAGGLEDVEAEASASAKLLLEGEAALREKIESFKGAPIVSASSAAATAGAQLLEEDEEKEANGEQEQATSAAGDEGEEEGGEGRDASADAEGEMEAAAAVPGSPTSEKLHSKKNSFKNSAKEDDDKASEIGETYYEDIDAASFASAGGGGGGGGAEDSQRYIDEWEVTRDFTSMSLTSEERREIDQLFKNVMYMFYKAQFKKASDILEKFLPILHNFPSCDPFHPDVARMQTTIKTIKARILFEQAQYPDAKEVFEDALQHRVEVFGKSHFLCVELYYYLGEWYRSQAEYDDAERYFNQVKEIFFTFVG